MKIYVMKILKNIKMCMLLNRMRIFLIVQELDFASNLYIPAFFLDLKISIMGPKV